MRVVVVVGLPGSGKSEAAAVARELDIPVVTMGDVIREECRNRELDPATHHGTVAKALREENGKAAVAERTIPFVDEAVTESETVLVDGLRSDAELDRFREEYGDNLELLRIDAPDPERAKRLELRGRDAGAADGGESLAERDERELGFGMAAAMERADWAIENDNSLDVFRERVQRYLEEGRP